MAPVVLQQEVMDAISKVFSSAPVPTQHEAWQKEEDDLLVALVGQHGAKNWAHIAESLPRRTGKQCRERWRNHLDPLVKKDPFTCEEDSLILTLVEEVGTKWALIARSLPGRTDNSVKNRYYSSLAGRRQEPKLNRFTEAEDEQILELVQTIGTRWSEIAKRMTDRSPKSVKNRFYSALKPIHEKRCAAAAAAASSSPTQPASPQPASECPPPSKGKRATPEPELVARAAAATACCVEEPPKKRARQSLQRGALISVMIRPIPTFTARVRPSRALALPPAPPVRHAFLTLPTPPSLQSPSIVAAAAAAAASFGAPCSVSPSPPSSPESAHLVLPGTPSPPPSPGGSVSPSEAEDSDSGEFSKQTFRPLAPQQPDEVLAALSLCGMRRVTLLAHELAQRGKHPRQDVVEGPGGAARCDVEEANAKLHSRPGRPGRRRFACNTPVGWRLLVLLGIAAWGLWRFRTLTDLDLGDRKDLASWGPAAEGSGGGEAVETGTGGSKGADGQVSERVRNFQLVSRLGLQCSNDARDGVLELPAGGLGVGAVVSLTVLAPSTLGGWNVLIVDALGDVLFAMSFKRLHNLIVFRHRTKGEWGTYTRADHDHPFHLDQLESFEIRRARGGLEVLQNGEALHMFHLHGGADPAAAAAVLLERLEVLCAEFSPAPHDCAPACPEGRVCRQGQCVDRRQAVDRCAGVACGDGPGAGRCVGGACLCADGSISSSSGSSSGGARGWCEPKGRKAGQGRCDDAMCRGRGYCADGECFCVGGFSGPTCEVEPDPCAGVVCSPHGRCEGGACLCEDGFTGKACSVAPNACEYTCVHGTCVGHRCECEAGFQGDSCDLPDAKGAPATASTNTNNANGNGNGKGCGNVFSEDNLFTPTAPMEVGSQLTVTARVARLDSLLAVRLVDTPNDYPAFVAFDFREEAPVRGAVTGRRKTLGFWRTHTDGPKPLALQPNVPFLLEVVVAEDAFKVFVDGALVVSVSPVGTVRHVQLSPEFEVECARLSGLQDLRGLTCFWHSSEEQTCFEVSEGQLPVACPASVTPAFLTQPATEPCERHKGHFCRVTCKGNRVRWLTQVHGVHDGYDLVLAPRGAFGVGVPSRPKLPNEYAFKGYLFPQAMNGVEALSNAELHTLLLYGFNLRGLECTMVTDPSTRRASAQCSGVPASGGDIGGGGGGGGVVSCPPHVTPAYLSVGGREPRCVPDYRDASTYCLASCEPGEDDVRWHVFSRDDCHGRGFANSPKCPPVPPFVPYTRYITPTTSTVPR